jgi:hypothetical protein
MISLDEVLCVGLIFTNLGSKAIAMHISIMLPLDQRFGLSHLLITFLVHPI